MTRMTRAREISDVNNAVMRAVLWFLGLFAAAVALALLMGGNRGVVTLLWAPWRVDVSLNLALLVLLAAITLPRMGLKKPCRFKKAASAQAHLADGWAHLLAGRATQARQAAAAALAAAGPQDWATQAQAHVLAAACENPASAAQQGHWQQAQAALQKLTQAQAPATPKTTATVPAGRRVIRAG